MTIIKRSNTTIHYRLERKDKAGRWMPVNLRCFLNYAKTLQEMKDTIALHNRYRRTFSKSMPTLPIPRRIAKITTHTIKTITRERVK